MLQLLPAIMDRVTSASAETFDEKIQAMFNWDGWDSIDTPLVSSLLVMAILAVVGIAIGMRARIGYKRKEYLEKPKGFMMAVELYYNTCDSFAMKNMGRPNTRWGGFFWTLFSYLFLSFVIPLFGLPSLVDWLACPLSLAIIMFSAIQITAIRTSRFSYFHRYIEPIFVFLPINLITMWSPIISTTMRLLGNCIAGSVLIGLIQWSLGNVSSMLLSGVGDLAIIGSTASSWYTFWNQPYTWTSIFLAPVPIGILQSYFTLFSGFIQTLVFSSLTAIWIAQEMPATPGLKETTSVPTTAAPQALAIKG